MNCVFCRKTLNINTFRFKIDGNLYVNMVTLFFFPFNILEKILLSLTDTPDGQDMDHLLTSKINMVYYLFVRRIKKKVFLLYLQNLNILDLIDVSKFNITIEYPTFFFFKKLILINMLNNLGFKVNLYYEYSKDHVIREIQYLNLRKRAFLFLLKKSRNIDLIYEKTYLEIEDQIHDADEIIKIEDPIHDIIGINDNKSFFDIIRMYIDLIFNYF